MRTLKAGTPEVATFRRRAATNVTNLIMMTGRMAGDLSDESRREKKCFHLGAVLLA